ncbi:VOC family protein [uncultured Tenacibaculum sp.]|uniref:VOC family protein n=1 Tax=uncultured Tenacibaculum sp. TaxID=174713 RepID=UPI00260C620D|nr:VOC family protein [uncultured Tenacibaculum sp.]
MKQNNFIWADLSCYRPEKAKQFYENVFGWLYANDNEYYTAYKTDKPVAGLYETPDKFKTIKMPAFWMSYIQVNDVDKSVEKARELGGIIELVTHDSSFGNVALIRDTLGAGFTIYDGNYLNARYHNLNGGLLFNELHVSNIENAISFYEELFDWNFNCVDKTSYEVFNTDKEHIANIHEIPETIRSKYEYWICTFSVENVDSTLKNIKENGGSLIFDEGNRKLCSDGTEAFFYIQNINN